jgi:hypothetical protein
VYNYTKKLLNKRINFVGQSSNDRNRKERGYARVNQQVNWVNDFEKEFRLKFFGNPTAESTEEKKL